MLRNQPNNKIEIQLQNIIDGKLKCDAINLRIIYYQHVVKQNSMLTSTLEEIKQKGCYEKEEFQDFIKEVEEKLSIYEKYFELLKELEQ